MKRFVHAMIFAAGFIALYAVPEIPMREPLVHYVGAHEVTVVENGLTCRVWSAPMFSNQRVRKVCS